MALVKCSKEIKTDILKKIDELFKDRINKAYELRNTTENEIADEVYNRIFTPARLNMLKEMAADVSSKYFILHNCSEFHLDAQVAEGIERHITGKWNSSRLMLPTFSTAYNTADVTVFADTTRQAIIDAAARRSAVIKEREVFKAQFIKAFEQVRSINELIKLWPAVIELLPTGTMDRINKKSGPRTPTSAEAIDAASLSVQLLKAKVAK